MKTFSAGIAGLLIILFSCGKKPIQSANNTGARGTSSATLIRVLCYNIHHANPPSRPDVIDLNAIANVIKQQQPDLVALQEVDVNTSRSGNSLDQAKELGRLTNMQSYFAKAIDYAGGEYGIAILSRYPIDSTQNQPLPTAVGTGGEPRTLATAVIKISATTKIVFACTHLDAQKEDTNRILQAKRIVDILHANPHPVILAGDFNATPATPVLQIFDANFTRSCVENCGFTIPVLKPTKTIDFIVYAPKEKFKVVSHRVIDETYASDHLPVMATFELR